MESLKHEVDFGRNFLKAHFTINRSIHNTIHVFFSTLIVVTFKCPLSQKKFTEIFHPKIQYGFLLYLINTFEVTCKCPLSYILLCSNGILFTFCSWVLKLCVPTIPLFQADSGCMLVFITEKKIFQ